jgi:glycosyltransferase involved in cell wall biosynthesis
MMEVFPSNYAGCLRSKVYARIRRLNQKIVSFHLSISRTTASDLARFWGIPTERIRVIYLGTARFRPNSSDGKTILADRFPDLPTRFVLSVYNLEPRKNLRTLLEAFPAVRDRYPDIRLVLFGRGAWTQDRETEFERQMASLGLGDAVVRLGKVSDLELATLYQIADVFVFPTLYEGFGLPLLEAMAVGGCVLTHEASAMAEIVGSAGRMINTSQPAAVARGLIDLLGDASQRARLREAAVNRAATFTAERMARETLSVYREAASYPSADN